jgi:2-methylcitrate dehydratase PrpD
MDITRHLAEHVHRVKFHALPRDVVEKGKQCFLDCMGSAIGGLRDEASEIIKDYVQTFGGEGKSTVIGTRMRRDMAHAALANGVIAHALDFDDYHSETVIHGTAACLPALLAVAENDGLSGQDLLTALCVGFDVSIRVGMALGSYHYERGWHSTSTSGIFGATAGVAKLMNLNPDQIVHAFGLCGTQASGLRQVFGTMTKPFHPGKAAMDALISCGLARKGFTSPEDILEGEMGVLEVLTENSHGEWILEGLGSRYHILDVSFKPYPTCA